MQCVLAQGSAGLASDLMRQIEERKALHSPQSSLALPGPPGWAPSPSSLNPTARRHSGTGSEASEDLHAAAAAAWQGSGGGSQRDLVRQASDQPTSMVGIVQPQELGLVLIGRMHLINVIIISCGQCNLMRQASNPSTSMMSIEVAIGTGWCESAGGAADEHALSQPHPCYVW